MRALPLALYGAIVWYLYRSGLLVRVGSLVTGGNTDAYAPVDLNPFTNGTFLVKNNNPGNLRGGGAWLGSTGTASGGFTVFDSAANGLRALTKNIINQARYGQQTVASIITKYAPPSDNNPTAAYIENVARAAGISPNAPVNLKDPALVQKIVAAIVKQEQGYDPFTAADYAQAYKAATG